MRKPFSIYCDWALHDELGDTVELTEELTMEALDTLARWKQKHGVAFDYYLIDCMWYERPGDYRSFNRKNWPRGFGPARQRMAELGLTPGLWLDTTGGQVTGYKPWAESLNVHDNWAHCLFDGPYAQGLLDAMLHAVEEWGVGMFKFDFANFRAVTARFQDLDAGEIYARNVAAFRSILEVVRRKHPHVLFLAYNGFVHHRDYLDGTSLPVVPGIDPAWLRWLDYIYSGDPRPADVPCVSLRRAVDLYQDHMVYKFHYSGLPLDRIDDHGCMVGTTNTIYYLGKNGWRRAWVMTLARGSQKAHFYGDVRLLTDADVVFLRAARELFFGLFRAGAGTRPVGGVPCQSPWHGFLTGDAADGALAVVNSMPAAQEICFPLDGLRAARVLFHDQGARPECALSREVLSIRLAPEQMALVGLGLKADAAWELGPDEGSDPVTPRSLKVDAEFASADGLRWTCPARSITEAADRASLQGLRVSVRLRDKNVAYRRAFRRDQLPADAITLALAADGRDVPAGKVVPDVKVWSGCSWLTKVFPVLALQGASELQLRISCADQQPRLLPEVWLQAL